MSKMVELLEQRAKKWDEAKAFLESKRDDSGIVSDVDTAAYRQMEAEVKKINDQIEVLEDQQKNDVTFSIKNAKAPVLPTPGASLPKTGRASNEYTKAFWNAMRHRVISNDLAIGTDSQGGYLVPDEFERTLVQALDEHNIMRQIARIIRTSSGELQIPVVSARGAASWLSEGESIPLSDTTFAQVTLNAYKLGTMIRVSRELLADSAFPLDTFLAQDFGRRIGELEEEAFVVGDGTGQPTGFLTSAQVGKTTASDTSITFDDVMDLYHSLKAPYRNKAVFVANDLTVKAFRKLKDNNGQYIWNASVVTGTPDTILGRPVYVSNFMPQIEAEAKILAFGDFSYFWIGDRQGRTFERLNELFSQTDQVGFKATQRVDAKLILPEAIQVLQMGTGDGGDEETEG